ncbi:Uncharacterised protein [Edwardsiella tarda]|nr:Uncharacterised protein [Edwardsiella tarda]
MNLERIAEDKISLGIIWISSENSTKKITDARRRSWQRVIEKKYRRIEYQNNAGESCLGFCSETASDNEPFALYIRDIFGDGAYYINEADDVNYILIINDGEVLEGTDIYVNDSFFEWYRKHTQSSKYSSLTWKCITMAHINDVLEANFLHRQSINKRKRTYFSVIVGVGVLCLTLFGFALKIFMGN